MKTRRKIAVVTGTRAEYGLLTPVIRHILESQKLELHLVVTGMHLMHPHGYTMNEIIKDRFEISKVVPMYLHGTENSILPKSFGIGTMGFAQAFEEIKPAMLLVLGDRLEILAAVIVAATMNIPICHIHGGEKAESGHIDESTRHAVSRFAHLHFTSSAKSSQRLERFGEEPWRIHQVGAPALDTILNLPLKGKRAICQQLRLDPDKQLIISLQHSVTIEKEKAGLQIKETMNSIKKLGLQTVVIYPNSDPGSEEIISVIEQYRRYPHIHIFPNLDHVSFLSLMKSADVMVGNSSSSIIESPSFHLPVVHIGTRNKGREDAGNILFVEYKTDEIIKAIKTALYDKTFLEKIKNCINPYGNGIAGKQIVNILENISIDEKLIRKNITY